jgi:hypothetical protein
MLDWLPGAFPWFTLKRLSIALLFSCTLLVVGTYVLSRPFVDFGVYWSAAHLFVSGRNPYSLTDVLNFQRSLGLTGPVPIMFLCPPWVLTIISPLGLAHSYVLALLAWMGVLACAVAVSSRLLMDIYFRDLKIAEISDPPGYRFLFAFTFYPVLLALKFVQLAPLMLLGVAGFLYYERRRPFVSGVFLFLTCLKPQLLFLVWIAILLRCLNRKEWKPLIGAAGVGVFFTVVALALDHHAFRQYWALMTGPFPQIVLSGMLGGVRSLLQPHDTYWLQYVPPFGGIVWFVYYWRNHRERWDWTDRMPALVTASVLTAAYSFTADQTLLMLAITFLAARAAKQYGRLPVKLVVAYTILNLGVLAIAMRSAQWALVPAPVLIALFLYRSARYRETGTLVGLEPIS